MFGLSYFWHGVFTNDYKLFVGLHRPGGFQLAIFLLAAVIAYLFIGFLVSKAFQHKFFDRFSQHPLMRGPAVGFACGMLVYIISLVIQFNLTRQLEPMAMLLDFVWQGIEQSIGGFAVGLAYMFVFEPFPQVSEEEEA